jgi:hypothetical protein
MYVRSIGFYPAVRKSRIAPSNAHYVTDVAFNPSHREWAAYHLHALPVLVSRSRMLDWIMPDHFLSVLVVTESRSASANLTPGEFVKRDMSLRRRWRHSQFLADQFWRRWRLVQALFKGGGREKLAGGGEECEGERKRAKKNWRGEKEIAPAGKPYVFSYLPKSRPLKNSQSVIRRN